MANKTWSMTDTQKSFIKELANYPEGVTLLDLRLEGKEFKTGSINILSTKGFIEVVDTKVYACDVVYNGVVIGKVNKPYKVYKLVQKD